MTVASAEATAGTEPPERPGVAVPHIGTRPRRRHPQRTTSTSNGVAPGSARYAVAMIAVIFHYWLGLLLFAVGLLACAGLIAGYVRKVVAPQYPGKRHRRDD